MTPQNSLSPLGSSSPSLAPVLIVGSLKVEIEQAVRLSLAVALYLVHAAARTDLPLVNETGPASIVPRVLLESLQAATRHTARDHKSLTFRDCSRPMCRDAANLIPDPTTLELGTMVAGLDAIFQQAMLAVSNLFSTTPPLISASPAPFEPGFMSPDLVAA